MRQDTAWYSKEDKYKTTQEDDEEGILQTNEQTNTQHTLHHKTCDTRDTHPNIKKTEYDTDTN